jgi:ABC-2 type transport system permease protein
MKIKRFWTEFRYRLARNRGQILGWGIALALYASLMVQFYGTILDQREQFEGMIDAYPDEMALFIGGEFEIFSPAGFLNTYIFSMMPLILGVFVVILGSGLLVGDEESGRLDLIAAHPVGRSALFWGRLAAFGAATLAIILLMWLGLALPSRLTQLDVVSVIDLAWPSLSLLAVMLLFGALSLLLSMFLPSRRMAAMSAGILLVANYFLTGLAYLNTDIEPIARLSPLWYYQGGDAIEGFNGMWFFGLMMVTLMFAVVAWWRFQRRDIRVGGEGGWQRPKRFSLSWLRSRRTSERGEVAPSETAIA